LGLIAGPVPPRVDACVKAGLLDLLDHAVAAGWSARRACGLLGLDDLRAARWADRRAARARANAQVLTPGAVNQRREGRTRSRTSS